jgi:predicted enzyme related to lactoylglutathione lyase
VDDGTFNLFAIMGSIASILVLWFRFRQGRAVRRLHDLTMGSGMMKISNAFASYSVDDLKRAKAFYGDLLALSVKETPEGLSLQFKSSIVFLYPKPNHQPATFTVLNFPVVSVDAAVTELTGRGIQFEHYDLPGLKTDERGISRGQGPTIAWFKDPAGNILSVVDMVESPSQAGEG